MKILTIIFMAVISSAQPTRKLPPKPTEEMKPLPLAMTNRVDPHGAEDRRVTMQMIKGSAECITCHEVRDRVITLPVALDSCFNCHNRSPHSGIAEHVKHKLNCISCHTFHRSQSVAFNPGTNPFKSMNKVNLKEGEIFRSAKHPMVKKNCVDCHKW